MAKKLIAYCITSFVFGAFTCGWAILVLSRGTSEIWVTNYVIQMASKFELDARSEYAKGNRVHTRDLMNSAFLMRLHLASSEYSAVWPIDMPLSGMVARSLGLLDLASLSQGGKSENQNLLFLFDCAVLVLSKDLTEANSRFYSIKSRFPQATREKCLVLGKAFLKAHSNPRHPQIEVIQDTYKLQIDGI